MLLSPPPRRGRGLFFFFPEDLGLPGRRCARPEHLDLIPGASYGSGRTRST